MDFQVQVNHPTQDEHIPSTTTSQYEEGPIPHKSVIKLAVLDVFANFCVTVGFAIVGSGVRYQSAHFCLMYHHKLINIWHRCIKLFTVV